MFWNTRFHTDYKVIFFFFNQIQFELYKDRLIDDPTSCDYMLWILIFLIIFNIIDDRRPTMLETAMKSNKKSLHKLTKLCIH